MEWDNLRIVIWTTLFLEIFIFVKGDIVFVNTPYNVRLYEYAPRGTHVLKVDARYVDRLGESSSRPSQRGKRDKKGGRRPSSTLEYQLSGSKEIKKKFDIDQDTGEITTKANMVDPLGTIYNLKVMVSASGDAAIEPITITVSKRNLFAPNFNQSEYQALLFRNATNGFPVTTVKANDGDPVSYNSKVYYDIFRNTSFGETFAVDELLGHVTLNKRLPLDVRIKKLRMTVVASNNDASPQKESISTLIINITDLGAPTGIFLKDNNMTHAELCWARTRFAEGYWIDYWPRDQPDLKTRLSTSNGECVLISNFTLWVNYDVQITPWNKKEIGIKSAVVPLRITGNICQVSQPCQNDGSCSSLNKGPGYNCTCKHGFYGYSCQFASPCLQNPCNNGGSCIQSVPNSNQFTCRCTSGYFGKKCQYQRADACSTSPCQNGGTCQSASSTEYTCSCSGGYYGKECQYFNPCSTNPCFNAGTCYSTRSQHYQCECPRGYFGSRCEHTNACELYQPCQQAESCRNQTGGLYTCDCLPGWYNQNCTEYDHCLLSPCRNNGNCISGDTRSFSCSCLQGFSGKLCESFDPCFSSPCLNSAKCTNVSSEIYKCDCPNGYSGQNCEMFNPCSSSPCQNSGRCTNLTETTFRCSCQEGYFGHYCQFTDLCFSNPCFNNASCISGRKLHQNTFACSCQNGYHGNLCQHVDVCAVVQPCQNAVNCTYNQSTLDYNCTCQPGWQGKNCSEYNGCHDNPCKNNAVCVSTKGIYKCHCRDGYYGTNCQHKNLCLLTTPCKNNGTCQNISSDQYECKCKDGFFGSDCETFNPCFNKECNGQCQSSSRADPQWKCNCSAGYYGDRCQYFDFCFTTPCQNNGVCSITPDNSSFTCQCRIGYYGHECQHVNPCKSSPCHNSGVCLNMSSTDYQCACPVGYFGKNCENKDSCFPSPCENNATCNRISNDKFECDCQTGYNGTLCEVHYPCITSPCSAGSTCQDLRNGSRVCLCDQSNGQYGDRCQNFNPCGFGSNGNTNLCKNGGKCRHISHNSFKCDCQVGFKGERCAEWDACALKPCKNNATCRDDRSSSAGYRCICKPGYTGLACDADVNECASNPCSQNQICMDHINGYRCYCLPGYTGANCETQLNECISSPCMNKGKCFDGINGYLCQCRGGFSGPNCELNIDDCASFPCKNGGTCVDGVSEYSCNCRLGYSGSDCEIAAQCTNSTIANSQGKFYWPYTDHSTTAQVKCPFGKNVGAPTDMAYRKCVLTSDGLLVWQEANTSYCKEMGAVKAGELTEDVKNLTSNINDITPEVLSDAADVMEEVLDYAIADPQIGESMATVISNIMEVDESVIITSSREKSTSKRLVNVLETFTKDVVIPDGKNITLKTNNLILEARQIETHKPGIKSEVVRGQWHDTEIVLPNEAMQKSSQSPNGTRVAFIVYSNSRLFVEANETNTTYGPASDRKVLSATIKDTSINGLESPVIFKMPNVQEGRNHTCAYWDVSERRWFTSGVVTSSSDGNYTTCTSDHLTNFAILLDPLPHIPIPKEHKLPLSIISYVGCGLSMFGLILTMVTYSIFRSLRTEKFGKILMNLCISMFLMNLSFLFGTAKRVVGNEGICTAVAILLHFFVLSTLMWMLIEAVHMYHMLVTIFKSYERRFMIKRCLIAWGIPFVIVGIVVAVDFAHYESDDEYCRLSANDPYVYYIGFLGPCCLILIFNSVVFILVSRVILKPRVKGLQGKFSQEPPKVSAAQVRGAISVMVLLGITWVFGAFAAGEARLAFSYVFCIANSLQGFLIFFFRVALYPEARLAWMQLVTTGTFRKTRGYSKSTSEISMSKDRAHAYYHHQLSKKQNCRDNQSFTDSGKYNDNRSFRDLFASNTIIINNTASLNNCHTRRLSNDFSEKNLRGLKYGRSDVNLSNNHNHNVDKLGYPVLPSINNTTYYTDGLDYDDDDDMDLKQDQITRL